jgi:hypothetical protein
MRLQTFAKIREALIPVSSSPRKGRTRRSSNTRTRATGVPVSRSRGRAPSALGAPQLVRELASGSPQQLRGSWRRVFTLLPSAIRIWIPKELAHLHARMFVFVPVEGVRIAPRCALPEPVPRDDPAPCGCAALVAVQRRRRAPPHPPKKEYPRGSFLARLCGAPAESLGERVFDHWRSGNRGGCSARGPMRVSGRRPSAATDSSS